MGALLRTKPLPLLLAALGALLLAGCGSAGGSGDVERDAGGLPVARVAARYATALADDPATLAGSMDAAFFGEVIAEEQTRYETLGDGGRATMPVSIFRVRVEASVGTPVPGTVVTIEQLGGMTEDGRVRVLLDRDTQIAPGGRYVFVARQDGPATYSAASFARFPVVDGVVQSPPRWEETGASRDLAGLTADGALERLANQ